MQRLLQTNRERLRRGLQWLWAQEGTAGQRARGVAAGVFCGCYPFFGLQMVLSVGLATLVRGNHLLAAAGTLVSNPLTYVPLYWFNFVVGNRLLGPLAGADLDGVNRSNLWNQGWDVLQRLLLGSTLVGALMALLLGLLAYRLFQQRTVVN
jgi:uncharacterized protein (DUF2062 family)